MALLFLDVCYNSSLSIIIFFFNDTATTEIYTLSLHDALPICPWRGPSRHRSPSPPTIEQGRSEEHTSELQSHLNLVCRLLLEKKKKTHQTPLQVKKTLQPAHRVVPASYIS